LTFFIVIAIDVCLATIRRQYEDLEREKQNLSLEQASREQTFRSELDQLAAEKEYLKKTIKIQLSESIRILVHFGNNV
jgi:hypothetical protein